MLQLKLSTLLIIIRRALAENLTLIVKHIILFAQQTNKQVLKYMCAVKGVKAIDPLDIAKGSFNPICYYKIYK